MHRAVWETLWGVHRYGAWAWLPVDHSGRETSETTVHVEKTGWINGDRSRRFQGKIGTGGDKVTEKERRVLTSYVDKW